MTKEFSRRDFLKLASVGAATSAVLTGCGPASRYVEREPYIRMPEYTYNGLSTYYATTCRECAAGCGLIVRTMQGRALKVEGNPKHPVNRGKTCARGQTTVEGLYNPNRVRGPIQHTRGEALYDKAENAEPTMSWDDAAQVVANALKDSAAVAFLMGTTSDHLFDLVSELASSIGAPAPVRFSAGSMFGGQATLSRAAEDALGQAGLPFFDFGNSDLVLSFGANLLETWLSPVAFSQAYAKMRRGDPKRRGYFIQFEARLSQTAAKADEWIPIRPGTEGLVALAIGRLLAEAKGGPMPQAYEALNVENVLSQSGATRESLESVIQHILESQAPVAIPGGAALGQSNGLAVANAVLALNGLVDNFGKAGGVFLSPLSPNEDAYHRPASAQEMSDFIGRMNSGEIKTLFVHGVNPVFEVPKALGFADALANVGTVISFATFPDETAVAADYIFPDRHGLEAWGYQRVGTGSAQSVLSGAQPVVTGVYKPGSTTELFYDARSTADVLIEAARLAGGAVAAALPFSDEVAYIQSKLANLISQPDGSFAAPEINSFSVYFQQHGGWWKTTAELPAPTTGPALNNLQVEGSQFAGEGEFFFIPFVSPTLAESGANKPWLQELADPTTTVMWNTWVEMNPEKAHELEIEDDDIIEIASEAGTIEAAVYKYPGIRPDTIAMPFGQGHTAYGLYAEGRGVNPANILGVHFNEAGDLAFAGMKVNVKKTGKKQVLSRMEGKLGVYGFLEEK